MSANELARAYVAKIERQQRAQSFGQSGSIRGAGERGPLQGEIYCEECGLLSMKEQSICSQCRASLRSWLQFVSLAMLGVLTAYNYVLVLNFPPTRVPHENLAGLWLNVSEFAWLYGWIALGVYVPAWAYYCWKKRGYGPETAVWVGIGFILILLMGAVARFIFPQMGWTWAEGLRTSLDSHPELGIAAGWAAVALALVSICCNRESRDRLLGKGKELALLALAVLCTILALSLFAIYQNAHL